MKRLLPLILLSMISMTCLGQETKIPWGTIDPTVKTEFPTARAAAPYMPYYILDRTNAAPGFRQGFSFQRNSSYRSLLEIDKDDDGTNRMSFYTGTTPYWATWPAVQGAATTCLQNDGAGNLTWASCAGANLWTQGTGEIHPTTADNHVQIGGGAAVSELRLLEPSGAGSNYTGWSAPSALAGDIVYDMPTADGSADYCLQTNADGTTKWGPCLHQDGTACPPYSDVVVWSNDFEAYGSGMAPIPPFNDNAWDTSVLSFCNRTVPGGGAQCGKFNNTKPHTGNMAYWLWGLDTFGLGDRYIGQDIHYPFSTYTGFQTGEFKFYMWWEPSDWTDTNPWEFLFFWVGVNTNAFAEEVQLIVKPTAPNWNLWTYDGFAYSDKAGYNDLGVTIPTNQWVEFRLKFWDDHYIIYMDGTPLITGTLSGHGSPTFRAFDEFSKYQINHQQVTPDVYFDDPSLTINYAYCGGDTQYVTIGGDVSTTEMRFFEASGNGTNYVSLRAPDALAANVNFYLPSADGTANQALLTNGSGVLSFGSPWTTAGGGWTDDGTVVRLTTATDTVAIGAATANSTGATVYVTKSATGAIGADLWITNSGTNALSSSARLAFGSDATADTTPNWGIEAPMVNVAGYRADMVFKAYDASSYAQKLRLINISSTQYALMLGTGTVSNLCCGDAFAIQGTYDSHQNVTQTFYRATGTTLGAVFSLIGTTAGDWVTNSAQHDFIIRGQSTVYMSSGTAGYKGYKLTETTHNWYVSDNSRMDLADTALTLGGAATAMSLKFKEPSGSGANYAAFKAQAMAADVTWTLPAADSSGTQCMKSNGSGTLSWGDCSIVTPAALSKTDDTNVTLTLGGTPLTALLQATSLTLGWTGQLGPARGGTGVANNAANTITFTGNFSLGATLTGNTSVTFPTSGTLATTAQLPVAGGSDTYVQFNDGGTAFGGDSGLVYNKTTDVLTIPTSSSTGKYVGNWQGFIDTNRFGFMNQTETTISFDGTSVFTLGDAGSGWSYYRSGRKYTISGNKTIDLLTVENPLVDNRTYYIYIDATDGTLSASINSWTLNDTLVPVVAIRWNNTHSPKYWMSEERHTALIDRRMHFYEHFTEGARLISAGALSGQTVNTDTDTAKTFGIDSSTMADEDILHSIAALTDPNGITTSYIVMYRTAASTWAWVESAMPFKYNTGTNYIQYDNAGTPTDLTGGPGANTRYTNSYLLVTNWQGAARYLMIPSQSAPFTTLAAAQAEAPTSFTFTGFPIAESVLAYRFTWKTDGSTSKGNCVLAATPQNLNLSAISSFGTGASLNHNTLAGLQGGTTNEYYHTTAAQNTNLDSMYYAGGTDVAVADGGTGLSSWTANGLVYASGTTTLTNSSKLTYASDTITFDGDTLADLIINRHTDDTVGGRLILRHTRGTTASPTATLSADVPGYILFNNYHTDASPAYVAGAAIYGYNTENSTHAGTGMKLVFDGTKLGTTGTSTMGIMDWAGHTYYAEASLATGNEYGYTFNYTVNKATSGNDTIMRLVQTNTSSPGTSYFLQGWIGSTQYWQVYADATASYQLLFGDGATSYINARYSDDTGGGGYQIRKARGTVASPTAALSGDTLGQFYWLPYHTDVSAAFNTTATIYTYLLENCTHAACGTGMTFALTPIGTAPGTSNTVANWADGGKYIGTAVLNDDTGAEIGFTFNYTTNKATSGDDYGVQIAQTDTASPGTSMLIRGTSGGALKWQVGADGVQYHYSNATGAIVGYRYSDDVYTWQFRGQKARGTQASPTAALLGDSAVSVAGQAYHTDVSAAYAEIGSIYLQLTENATHSASGSQWVFYTTANSTATPRIAAVVGQDSGFIVGYTTDFDPIKIMPVAKGANAYTGIITSADLTAARTWTLQNGDGTIYQSGGTDVAVADGGTGLSSWTANGIVYASGTTTLANSPGLQTDGATYVSMYRAGADANPPVVYLYKSRGTVASPTATQSGDFLADFGGNSYHTDTSAAWYAAAAVAIKATENATHAASGAQIEFYATTTGTASKALKMTILNGVIIGSPTGSFKGDGTLNATGVYDDNALLTDHVFDYYLDGKLKDNYEPRLMPWVKRFDPTWLDIGAYESFWKTNRRLPTMADSLGQYSVGEQINGLTLNAEILAIQVVELSKRIAELEKKLKQSKE